MARACVIEIMEQLVSRNVVHLLDHVGDAPVTHVDDMVLPRLPPEREMDARAFDVDVLVA